MIKTMSSHDLVHHDNAGINPSIVERAFLVRICKEFPDLLDLQALSLVPLRRALVQELHEVPVPLLVQLHGGDHELHLQDGLSSRIHLLPLPWSS
jgi:hypothetical protein